MGIPANFDGVEAWSGTQILGAGWHTVKVIAADDTKRTQKGSPQLELQMEALDGSGQITDWIVVQPNTYGKVKQVLDALQWQAPAGNFEIPTGQLINRSCRIFVAEEPKYNDPTKIVSKVKSYEPSGNGVAGGMGGDPIAQAAAAPVQNGVPPVGAGGVPHDDIPF